MKSYLQELENNEAILLMFIAGELPPQDRAEVEQMLASDPALRSELEILRQTQQLSYDALETLDASTRPPIPQPAALDRVGRLMREWTEMKSRPPVVVSNIRRASRWRRAGLSAAALLLVSYYVWFAYHPNTAHSLPPIQSVAQNDPFLNNPDDLPSLAPSRDLSNQERLTLLSNSLEDSASDESSNLHVAEVAAISNIGDADSSTDANRNSDQNPTGEP